MKKKILIPAVLLAAFAGLVTSCSKYYGDPVTQNYAISGNYSKLDVSHAFDVTVSDDVTEAVVTVPERLHGKLKIRVKEGVLEIGFKSNLTVSGRQCTVVLPRNTQLRDLELSGASTFRGDLQGGESDIEISGASEFYGNVTATDVEFDISGSSTYKGAVSCDKVDVELSGSSNATLSGACTGTMDIHVSGSSKLDAIYFDTDAVTGSLSGSSDADVTVCNRIAVSVSGASDLTYGTSSIGCRPTYGCTTSGSSSVTPR